MNLRVGSLAVVTVLGTGYAPAVAQTAAHADGAAAVTLDDAGDILGAAMALERALARDPDAADIRAYYAALLCRLDNADGARAELAKLDGNDISETEWAKVTKACGPTPRPRKVRGRTGISGEVSAGHGYDSDQLGVLSVQFTVPGFVGPVRGGFAIVGAARLNAQARLGSGSIYSGISARTKNDLSGVRSDYQLGEITAGYNIDAVSVGVVVRHGRIIDRSFVSEAGAQGEVVLTNRDGFRVGVRGEIVRQSYPSSSSVLSRNGDRFDLAVFVEKGSVSGISYLAGAAFEAKRAGSFSEDYRGGRAYAGVRLPMGHKGQYWNLSGTYRYASFRNSPLITPRRDHRLLSRLGFGTPLIKGGLIAEAAISYTLRRFNAASGFRSFDNFGAELRLIWKFGR